MLLSQLAKVTEHTLVGEDREIANIEYDSRKVHEGDLFCCVTGTFSDGHEYAPMAKVLGAAALLYLVPCVLLFLGYAIGNALGWAEGGCVLIGFGFFALGVAFNVIYQRKKKASPITFEIIQIRES